MSKEPDEMKPWFEALSKVQDLPLPLAFGLLERRDKFLGPEALAAVAPALAKAPLDTLDASLDAVGSSEAYAKHFKPATVASGAGADASGADSESTFSTRVKNALKRQYDKRLAPQPGGAMTRVNILDKSPLGAAFRKQRGD